MDFCLNKFKEVHVILMLLKGSKALTLAQAIMLNVLYLKFIRIDY